MDNHHNKKKEVQLWIDYELARWLAGKPESVPIDTIDEKTVARKINHFISNLDLIDQWLASRTRVKEIEKEIDSREKETTEVEK